MLIAQSGGPTGDAFSASILVAVVLPIAVLALIVLFIVVLLRHLRFQREKLHAERLKMIEMGYPLEEPASTKRQEKYMHNTFWISFWMVFAVPSSAFSAATAATQQDGYAGYVLVIWIGASVASVAAVVCAAVLMIHCRARQEEDDDLRLPPQKPISPRE